MNKVNVIMLSAPGTNCDAETMFAFQQAGAAVSLVRVNQLTHREEQLANYQIMVIPGGFTYGDDVSAGRVLANELRIKLGEDIMRFTEDGKLIMGICNGFQALVKAGFLPEPSQNIKQGFSFTNNDSGKFECRWVHLGVNKECSCVFTEGIDNLYLPVAHGEGKVVVNPEIMTGLNVALYYTDEHGSNIAGYPHNPNGSAWNIAGICDSSGHIFGLMPHPERHVRGTQHPQWTRLGVREYGDGFHIFRNAVEWAKKL
jgi:phosphoribosylformylglycinamidine synthase I